MAVYTYRLLYWWFIGTELWHSNEGWATTYNRSNCHQLSSSSNGHRWCSCEWFWNVVISSCSNENMWWWLHWQVGGYGLHNIGWTPHSTRTQIGRSNILLKQTIMSPHTPHTSARYSRRPNLLQVYKYLYLLNTTHQQENRNCVFFARFF